MTLLEPADRVEEPLPPLTARRGARPHVVVVGGGFAGAEALLALRALAGERVSLQLVCRHALLDYRPLEVRAPFAPPRAAGATHASLATLCAEHDVDLRVAAVRHVDVPTGLVQLDTGESLPFDALLLAPGAHHSPVVRGARTFERSAGIVEVRELVARARRGELSRIAFAVPAGITWPLPLYELALQTAQALDVVADGDPSVTLVTAERAPLAVFGPQASGAVARLLAARGIGVVLDAQPEHVSHGVLRGLGCAVPADAVVALPVVSGMEIPGLRGDADGFLAVDAHGRVDGTSRVYAAGDVTAGAVKQGGLATQQADAAAAAIAARVGADVEPAPYVPVLRALLLGGDEPLRLAGTAGSGKVAARYLSPWLARHGVDVGEPAAAG